jgi:hypothetical protein
MRKWELDSLQLKRVHIADIDLDQIIERTPATVAVMLIIEICAAIENNGDIIVAITEIIGIGNHQTVPAIRKRDKFIDMSTTFIAYDLI